MNFASRPRRSFLLGILLVPLCGAADYLTGYEFGFFAFYFLPVSIAAWYSGSREGGAVALLSALTWFVSDRMSGHSYSSEWFRLWNVLIRLASFLIVALTLSRLRFRLIREQEISADLRKALSEVKTLTGLLPMCSWCRKIRDDAGYWQRIEEYIGQRTRAEFTHGLCEECAAKILKESGLDPEDDASATPNESD
ncbi:DUF4118 domain-containing protein [Candidatus Sumerlaeota bacterium]|nr:DUF4118 domain-containing protein [Candidatus Sumerlaeota bacterium]